MIELQSVVLPMPLRPITETASVAIENETPSSACAEPYDASRPSISSSTSLTALPGSVGSSSWKRLPR